MRKSVPAKLKNKLWNNTYGSRAGEGKCYVCSCIINSKRFEAGHIISVFHGGETTLSNLKCICSTCNKSMGTENLEIFKKKYFTDEKEVYICKRKTIPKAVKDRLWDITYGSSAGEGECYSCNRIINSKHFKTGYLQKNKKININNLKCICKFCYKKYRNKNLKTKEEIKEERNNLICSVYKRKEMKRTEYDEDIIQRHNNDIQNAFNILEKFRFIKKH